MTLKIDIFYDLTLKAHSNNQHICYFNISFTITLNTFTLTQMFNLKIMTIKNAHVWLSHYYDVGIAS